MRNTDTTVVEALLSKGADIKQTNAEKETPLMTAEYFRNEAMISFLNKYNSNSTCIRPFEVLCKEYLDKEDECDESEQIKKLSEQIRILKGKIEDLESMKQ